MSVLTKGNIKRYFNLPESDIASSLEELDCEIPVVDKLMRPYLVADFAKKIGLLDAPFRNAEAKTDFYIKGKSLDRVSDFKIISEKESEDTEVNHRYFQVNMTALVRNALEKDQYADDDFNLYRQISWRLMGQKFASYFLDENKVALKVNEEDSQTEGMTYYQIKNDRMGIKSSKLYAYTKELWFYGGGYKNLPDEEAVSFCRPVYDAAVNFYKNIGLFQDNYEDILPIARCIHLYTFPDTAKTVLGLNIEYARKEGFGGEVLNIPFSEAFKNNMSISRINI